MTTKKTKGNGPGKGNKAISTAVPLEIYRRIEVLAEKSNMKPGRWAREVLIRSAKSNEIFALYPLEFNEPLLRVAETSDPQGNTGAPQKKTTSYKTA